jgi:hypothetical protein
VDLRPGGRHHNGERTMKLHAVIDVSQTNL